jgi:diguanylate cyclase
MDAFDDELKTASLIAKRILPDMAERKVPVTPENYHVWFEYSRGANAELVAEIDQLKASGAIFDRETNERLYNKYLGHEKNKELQEQLHRETQRILKSALDEILVASDATSDYGSKLEEYAEKLNNAKGFSETRRVIESVLKDTVTMSTATQQLQGKLDEATSNTESLKQKLELTAKEALTDPLTGLPNRKAFGRKIEELLQGFQDNASVFAVLMLDIDFFKQFNDQYGHKIGDEVLQLVSSILMDCLKGKDCPARYGGEEFIVLLPDTGETGASVVAEQIRKAIAGKKLKVVRTGESLRPVTVSIGVSAINPKDDIDSVVQRADMALYLAKSAGRNCVRSEKELPTEGLPAFSEAHATGLNSAAAPASPS